MYILIVLIYILGFLVIILPKIFSNKISLNVTCIDIKKSSKLECPVFEIIYKNEKRQICNEVYKENLNFKKGNDYKIYITKNNLNNFSYNEKNIYQMYNILGVVILTFATIFLISELNFSEEFNKTFVASIILVLGSFLTIYNILIIFLLLKKCTVKIIGKVVSFNRKTEESYDYEKRFTSVWASYSPVYKFNYKNNEYEVTNNVFLLKVFKIVKKGKSYKIRINPNNPSIFIDRIFIVSKLINIVLGILAISLGTILL